MKARGFTLVELILVIILLGIMATATLAYLGLGAQMYSEVTAREQLLAQSRFALERLTRELRGATPNSIRLKRDATTNTYQCLEYVPFVFGGIYTDAGFDGDSKDYVDVVSSLDFSDTDTLATLNGASRLVIYPSASNGDDVYLASSSANSVLAGNIDADEPNDDNDHTARIYLDAAHTFPKRSPEQRMYLLKTPVSYCLVDKKLWRYAGYDYENSQPTPADFADDGVNGVLMGEGIANSKDEEVFRYSGGTLVRNAVINLLLHFELQGQTDTFFNHEVHLANVP